MNAESLAVTLESQKKTILGVHVISGFERSWSNRVVHEKRTGLGVIQKDDARVNGIVYEVSESDISRIDEREVGYARERVKDATFFDGTLWVYTISSVFNPTPDFPIALSYVDCILSGCFLHSEECARDFIRLTQKWNFPIINDRDNPLFPRGVPISKETYLQIDNMLQEMLPYVWKQI